VFSGIVKGSFGIQKVAMNPIIVIPEKKGVLNALHYHPVVSIIMPFEPKMHEESRLAHSLEIAVWKIEQELMENYSREASMLVMQKLQAITRKLDYNTYKKSIAIYVSPEFEKVLYLDIDVEEKIRVSDSFDIRDLVYCKKQLRKYLVLQLGEKESHMYLGCPVTLVRIISSIPRSVNTYADETPENFAGFSDICVWKQAMKKFLHDIDNSLGIILSAYQLPLFVTGTEKILGQFKEYSRYKEAVIGYVQGDYENATVRELKEALMPHIADWDKVMQKYLLNQLEAAAGDKKLVTGIHDVCQEAMRGKGRLLVVEKNYRCTARENSNEDTVDQPAESYSGSPYLKDVVDSIIEKVLVKGGDVEFVDKGILAGHRHIALIKYY
jgi:hypothetical protein